MKKAIVARSLIMITLAVVFIFSLMGLGMQVLPRLMAESQEDLCLKTLTLMHASRDYSIKNKVGLDLQANPLTSPQCDIHFETIQFPKDKKESSIYADIAEQMRTCWKKTGAGNLDPFAAKEGERLTHCIMCSKIDFDEKITGEWKTLTGLWNYLGSTKMPLSEETYMQYFCPDVDQTNIQCPYRDNFKEINTSKSYYINMVFSKGPTFFYWFQTSGDVRALGMLSVDMMPRAECNYLYS